MQLKQYEIVCDVDKLKVDIQQTCMEHKTIKQWAYINHDKDDTRPHYHIYVNFMYRLYILNPSFMYHLYIIFIRKVIFFCFFVFVCYQRMVCCQRKKIY